MKIPFLIALPCVFLSALFLAPGCHPDPPGIPYTDFRQKWAGTYYLQHDSTRGLEAVYGPPGTQPTFQPFFYPGNAAFKDTVAVRFDTAHHIIYAPSTMDSTGLLDVGGYLFEAHQNGIIDPYYNLYDCYNQTVRARFGGDTLFFSSFRNASPCAPTYSNTYYHGTKK